jgi:ubiquinone/menaquinone biosynthesis C-methylase UbiE
MNDHWDQQLRQFQPGPVDRRLVSTDVFWSLLGDVRGKEVLDLGCGSGDLAVLLSLAGARVTAIDQSPQAITNAKRQAELNGAGGIGFVCASAAAFMASGRTFDLVTGKYILHHIEPFGDFVPLLRAALRPGGRAVFIENSARNPLLMLARRHLVGRCGLPRRSDGRESPFSDREIALLRKTFRRVTVAADQLVLFRLLPRYFFPRNERWGGLFNRLDRLVYRYYPGLRRYGYQQVIVIEC